MADLYKAVTKFDNEIVAIPVEVDDAQNYKNCISLHKAALCGNTQIVEFLLQAGANINAGYGRKYTPLHNAVTMGHVEIVEILLKAMASTNVADEVTYRPLHRAVTMRHAQIVKMLLKAGANINAEGWKKFTSLHHAAAMGNKEIVEILLDFGASCNAECTDGHTPLYYSSENGHTEVSEYLREHGATGGRVPRWIMCHSGSTRALTHTKLVHVRREATGVVSGQTDRRETTAVTSESWDIQGGAVCDQIFNKDQQIGDRRCDNTTECSSDSTGNNPTITNDSQQSATSDLSPGFSQQECEDFGQQVADLSIKFSDKHKGQQRQCSTDVTSKVKKGNISVKVNINISNNTTNHNYNKGSTQITDAESATVVHTLNQVHGNDVHSDSETEESGNEC